MTLRQFRMKLLPHQKCLKSEAFWHFTNADSLVKTQEDLVPFKGHKVQELPLQNSIPCMPSLMPPKITSYAMGYDVKKLSKMRDTHRHATNENKILWLQEIHCNRANPWTKAQPPEMSMFACLYTWTMMTVTSSFPMWVHVWWSLKSLWY